MKKSKLIRDLVVIISIINIMFLVFGYIITVYIRENRSIYEYTEPITVNSTIFFIIALIFQILNIILSMKFLKMSSREQIIGFSLMIFIIICTVFIPVRGTNHTEYRYPTGAGEFDIGSSTTIMKYKNLYGIVLKTDKIISDGIPMID